MQPEPPKEWILLSSRIAFKNKWLKVKEDKVKTHLGHTEKFYYLEHPGTVGIVPIDKDNNITLIEQYRPALRMMSIEIPAGRIEAGYSIELNARRELQEEVGGISSQLKFLGNYYLSNGSSNEKASLFLAFTTTYILNNPEATEHLKQFTIGMKEAQRLVDNNIIQDSLSVIGITLANSHIIWGGRNDI
jgi:ADP-ribose pyrophosphatase